MTPAGALESREFEDSSTTLPGSVLVKKTTIGISQPWQRAPGKTPEKAEQALILNNRPTSGTFTKNRVLQTTPTQNNANGGYP